tara:strand:+ start:159 stop:590 length:432 start_codon:yes stop_codon:yes gene_type:complete
LISNFEILDKPFNFFTQGKKVKFEKTLTVQDIDSFAKLTGDKNPLHCDEEYAIKTKFKRRIPHGMLAGSFFSTLVGMYLPGKNCLYLSQNLLFHKPVPLNEPIIISGEIITKIDSLNILIIHTSIKDKLGNLIIDGEAKVKVL